VDGADTSRIVAMVVGFCWFLLFFFVPETFWDRTPRPKSRSVSRLPSVAQLYHRMSSPSRKVEGGDADDEKQHDIRSSEPATTMPDNTAAGGPTRPTMGQRKSTLHVGFSVDDAPASGAQKASPDVPLETPASTAAAEPSLPTTPKTGPSQDEKTTAPAVPNQSSHIELNDGPPTSYFPHVEQAKPDDLPRGRSSHPLPPGRVSRSNSPSDMPKPPFTGKPTPRYTALLQTAPKRSFIQQLRPYEGRLHQDNWFRVALRPFILFAYPAVLWSAIVYSCSIGWLIVISESVAVVYRDAHTYNFSALSAGLIYLSPFIGGVLGTAVAGKVSDVVVRAMARRNGGLYEPEFRLVMAAPVALTTVVGLMGFGWSAESGDHWIVPTVFFGTVSFGCSLGSTTAITFCVDSYRQYAGEALVTLNFSKNIFHGLVFSLFVNVWLEAKGAKEVFLALGGIQLGLLALTVPMYIWGKRARMWTARMNLMERF